VWLSVHLYCFHTLSWMNNFNNWHLQASLFGRGPAFLIGMGCAWFHRSTLHDQLFGNRLRVWGVLIFLLVGLYTLLRWYAQAGQLPALRALPMFHNIEAIFWGGILLCCMSLRGRGKWIFINPVMSHFGVLSYSIYLVHVPVQYYLITWLRAHPEHWLVAMGTAVIITVSFVLAWILSLATYYGLERPCLQLKARIPTFSKQRKCSEQKEQSLSGAA
ncbi:MAG: acyltransferase, partial [Pseudomonas sp.]|uniref:acyltransferase family protein n=1 Tax=Pseudomonas sp. TaxID=306 RepID=UPI003BB71E81